MRCPPWKVDRLSRLLALMLGLFAVGLVFGGLPGLFFFLVAHGFLF